MIIKSAKYIISAVGPKQYPETGFPEVVFVGRSNVGKSSLINSLVTRRALARTSTRPGKTQTINFYELNEQFYFVDVPGYGYAQVSRTLRQEWGVFISRYLQERDKLVLIVHLIDIRHEPMKNDQEMSIWLRGLNVPYLAVTTKADKITRGRRNIHLAAIRKGLKLEQDTPVMAYSSETGEGREQLWNYIKTYVCDKSLIDGG
jgi:GTP-binding protein